MLELKQIVKDYPTVAGPVHALRGIDLCFRKNEFVSILGPSGCGKTTMLNIIGGLDQYSSGDLVINGKSTKDFKDRDWDGYRNHSIGFVFQSYNLIPHQTVLSNVELALTLSGVSKKERRERAIEALKKVGLGDRLHNRPSQMSGGQMQRVAIARAIVNQPDIILADEPTGALDTETGIQVMEILKEIAKDRLVIMVTHNPDLAEIYSTRIVSMVDGVIINDSNPVSDEEKASLVAEDNELIVEEKQKVKKEKKPSMSFFTSFLLSLNNLFTKKGRTILTSFAGSIGIIGIALIYAVSNGANVYINVVQEEALTAYPISLQAETIELSSLIELFMGKAESGTEHENDAVYQKTMLYSLVNSINSIETSENDLATFKTYLEKCMADPGDTTGLRDAVSGIQYSYGLNFDIYTKSVDGKIIKSDVSGLMRDLIIKNMANASNKTSSLFDTSDSTSSTDMTSMMSAGGGASSYSTLFQEMLPGKDGKLISDIFDSQYDLIYGSWPNDYNEVVLVVDEKNEITDLALYALGLISEDEVQKVFDAVGNKEQLEITQKNWSYEDICNGDYRLVLPGNCYTYNAETGEYEDLRDSDTGVNLLYNNAIKLKVCGIIRADEDALTTIMNGAIGYTTKLTEYIISNSQDSAIVKAQKETPEKDIFSGLLFKSEADKMTAEQKAADFRKMIEGKSVDEKAEIYINIMSIPGDDMFSMVSSSIAAMPRVQIEAQIMQTISEQMAGVSPEYIQSYIGAMSDDELRAVVYEYAKEQASAQYAEQVKQQLSMMSKDDLAKALDFALAGYTDELCATYFDETAELSNESYESNLISLGCIDMGDPVAINIYASTFEAKDAIQNAINEYNKGTDEIHEIKYTDYVGIMMSSITTILNAITIVLIGFVAISLVVSSIMIGVITLISVQERTKEIGILRAIGASKKNVSSMFNAETLIIGFTSGLFGVLITYLLCIPINIIVHALTDINNLSAQLPVLTAVILVFISMFLTLIAGIIPSRSAAKKDPVIALRTE